MTSRNIVAGIVYCGRIYGSNVYCICPEYNNSTTNKQQQHNYNIVDKTTESKYYYQRRKR